MNLHEGTEIRGGYVRLATALLNIILASFFLTPRQGDDTLVIECRDDVIPLRDFFETRVIVILSLLKQITLDGLE